MIGPPGEFDHATSSMDLGSYPGMDATKKPLGDPTMIRLTSDATFIWLLPRLVCAGWTDWPTR